MMVYFYERLSDGLHQHFVPAAGSSSIDRSFYVSRGYLLFVPDIPYRIGYPGESALDAVVPGVLDLVDQGFVDRDKIGVQGHSWGGYQIAYMVTRTDLFAAAEAGAPVANMVSAYGGIRWQSGMSRALPVRADPEPDRRITLGNPPTLHRKLPDLHRGQDPHPAPHDAQ